MSRRRAQKVKREAPKQRLIVGVEDMVLLPDVRDVGIMGNLKTRLSSENIYTFIGHVLVVCNPYKWLQIYEETVMKQYIHQSRVDVAPHIFATAEGAYRALVTEEDSQCIIISGESGAGKTEASKQIQSYIATVCGSGEGVDKIKRVFLESNPVLEAFGNAKTLRNNNSSRFGKYFNLQFNRYGSPLGGVITNYLLEKSRIVRPNEGERNFHIFYQLIASKYKEPLGLKNCSAFNYLSCSNCYTVEGTNDPEEFETTIAAMRNVGMGNSQIQAVLSLLASVLHLGNVQFRAAQVQGADGCTIVNSDEALAKFCELLKLNPNAVEASLLTRELQTMAAGGKIDTFMVPQNPVQAAARRDAIAKTLYERMFDMIVARINTALDADKLADQQGKASTGDMLSIGVLDIYGFEIFDNNSFEQLCINYVNEKLQQIFIELTLRAEQDEYEREGITWTPIPFFNNRIVCELLDSAKPPGVFRILDDTCKTMHGTKAAGDVDKKFLESLQQFHASHKHFHKSTKQFTVKHYAGDVHYSAGKFAESNKDALNKDLITVLKTSEDRLVQYLFPEEVDMDDKKAPPTAGFRIRNQCAALVAALMDCSPHYVRCVKSNDRKAALSIDETRVKHQVKYLGLAENIKVRRAGFAFRADFHRFLDRFAIMSPATYPDWRGSDKEGCNKIIKAVLKKSGEAGNAIDPQEMQLGNTKVFVRKPETYFELEKLREVRIGDFVAVVQRAWRRYVGRKEFVILQTATAKLYAAEKKIRRRDSIYRPFIGDYLDSCGKEEAERIRDSIFRIIDYYDVNENIVFADPCSYQICSSADTKGSPPSWTIDPRLIVMTDKAMYLMQKSTHYMDAINAVNPPAKAKGEPKQLPRLILRRRIPLVDVHKALLTRLADNCIGFNCDPGSMIPNAALANKEIWAVDDSVKVCPVTDKPFSLFTRRHHCRISGDIFSDLGCDFRQTLPDSGFEEPQRIGDPHIGLVSMDPMEDIMLVTDKKTEMLSLCQANWKKCKRSELPITFSNNISLHPALPLYQSISRIPAREISFQESAVVKVSKQAGRRGRVNADAMVHEHGLKILFENATAQKMTIQSEPGLPHDIVEERQRRHAARARKAEARRRRQDEERRQRQAVKEEEREQERLQRLNEKKARKAAEREAKQQEERKTADRKPLRATGERRKFGNASPTPGDASDRSISPPPVAGNSTKGPGKGRGASPAAGAASSAGSELAAAMARRRAAMNG